MTEPGYVPPPATGWWVKRNRTVFPTRGTFTLTGGTPIVFASDRQIATPTAGTLTLTGLAPTVSVGAAAQPTLIGSASVLANTIAIPTHQVNDLIVICAVDWNSDTASSKPGAGGTVPAWVDIDTTNTGVFSCSIRTAYFKATATTTTSGTWGTNTYMAVAVLRNQSPTSPLGGHAQQGGFSTNITAPAITLSNANGSSAVLCFHFARTVALGSAPTGYTRQVASPGPNLCLNTKDVTTTDGAIANIVGSTDNWRAAQIEIKR